MTRRLAKSFAILLFLILLLPLLPVLNSASAQPAIPAPPPLEPASTGGVAAVERALAQLSTHRRLLVVGAHPDDEDTSLIALVARGMGGAAAYLSLSRGEGGQNLIGPELGVGLGLIRSRELLAARSVDGGRQFFTRAYDFGYTRSLDETLRLWPKDVLVEDAVRVIRRFKPQVIVSVFPGVPHPNHGQHQAAGVTAYTAFPLAGDPKMLPGLAAEGLSPWAPQALYRSTRFEPDSAKTTTLTLPLNGVDPLAGKSIFQLAMASRSMHRSQDMGQIQRLGPQESRVGWVDGTAGKEGKDLFDGIDTRLSGMVATVADAGRRKAAEDHLAAAQAAAEKARTGLIPGRLDETVPAFLSILRDLREARAGLTDEDRPARELIDEKIDIAEAGLAAAAGIAVDATTDREELVDGETFTVQTVLWNSGTRSVSGASVTLESAPEWSGEPLTGDSKELAAGALGTWELKPTVPASAPATIPYFLRKPLMGSLYDWSAATPAERGEPFGPPPLVARFRFTLEGVPVSLEREVVHLHRDQATGEVRRPLRLVPAVEVAVADDLLVWPVQSREPRRLRVTLTSHSPNPVSGRLEATGWPSLAPQTFNLGAAGEPEDLELTLTPPKDFKPGRTNLELAAVLADGQRFSLAVPEVDYPHIRATPRPVPARVAIQSADLRLPPLKRVGYVRGASDRVPEFLRQAGVPLELLGPEQLGSGDLGRYDVLVIGSRAYETDPSLARANHRILDYVKNGGHVVVQYQQYPYIEGKFAPFPLDIARPHDRITDETAPVTVLDPASPVFNTPNKIGPEDWNGWIQERGLYFAHTWDPAYTPLLSMKDPDIEDLKGGLLVAKVGKGTYVYTGLAFFRQLPAGVPGGYRLFANLLGLK
ncbi:MAG TPA: PIG-L family deacetylase [Thermoanaerobaculia bacterium]|jgi:LmbE family N-acetylglucosaminyl deacetylase|nr:PIG-L family deacetylase [Thermoanaerobaculia bacterium]